MSSHAELYRPQLEALVEDATRIGYLQGYKHAQGRIAALQAELDRVRCMLGEARIGLSTLSAEIERLRRGAPRRAS